MLEHPLFATLRRSSADPDGVRPVDAIYNFDAGMWSGPRGPLCEDPMHIPTSKKNDIETGEDQKGK